MSASSTTLLQTLVPPSLLELAPLRLANHRKERYIADDLSVKLGQLAPRDQTLLRDLYTRLTDLLYRIADPAKGDAGRWDAVEEWTQQHNLDRCIEEAREIGLASTEHGASEALSEALHDVRGGALASLLGRLQLLGYLRADAKNLNAIFVQARDHLKIMRSALVGLDDVRRDADRQPKKHALGMMLDKWQQATSGPKWHDRPLRLEVSCHQQGALTECCLESAAVDRIFYNLAANAGRYANDDRLEVTVFALPEPSDQCFRFVFSNQVSDVDAARLRAIAGASGADSTDLGRGKSLFSLFESPAFSPQAEFGLTVVADFVARAFGLSDREQALQERYVGAVLDGQTLQVWFHWPMADESLPPKADDYHRPEQSLSEP